MTTTADESNSISHLLHARLLLHASKPFLGTKIGSHIDPSNGVTRAQFTWETFEQVHRRSAAMASALASELGLARRSIVGLCGPNVPRILMADFAACFNDYVTVGLHHSWDAESLSYVVSLAEVKCVFCTSADIQQFASLKATTGCPTLSHLVLLDDKPAESSILSAASEAGIQVHNWSDLEAIGLAALDNGTASTLTGAGIGLPSWFGCFNATDKLPLPPPGFSEDESEAYTLLFTSGTSGTPKGVVVTKKRWLRDATVAGMFAGQSNPTVLSYMSFAHGGDRGICWQGCFSGAKVAMAGTCSSSEDLMEAMRGAKPTFFLGMSHTWSEWYLQYNRELQIATLCGLRESRSKIQQALIDIMDGVDPNNNLGASIEDLQQLVQCFDNDDHLDHLLSELVTLPTWHQFCLALSTLTGTKETLTMDWVAKFGGEIFIPVTGGGHTSKEVIAWMDEIFTPPTTNYSSQPSQVKNSYGSSEFPGIALNGSVNQQIELEIDSQQLSEGWASSSTNRESRVGKVRGEILVRHKDRSVSVSYFKNPAATSIAVTAKGWYRTGDIGELDFGHVDEFGEPTLSIIDRVSNSIELYYRGDSRWVDPSKLESAVISKLPFVHSQMFALVGDRNQDSLVLIAVPTREFILEDAVKHVDAATRDFLVANFGLATSDSSVKSKLSIEQQQELYVYMCGQPCVWTYAKHVLLATVAQLQLSITDLRLEPYEVPCGVILTAEPWSVQNKLLTTTGKPRRSEVRMKFQREIEDTYARTTEVSAEIGMNLAIVPSSVASVSRSWFFELTPVAITFPSVCEVKHDGLAKIFVLLLKTVFYKVIGPESTKTALALTDPSRRLSSIKVGWGGYIQQDESSLPMMEGTANKKDYQYFSFKTGNAGSEKQLNDLLDAMKCSVQERAKRNDEFLAHREQCMAAIDKELAEIKEHFHVRIQAEVIDLNEKVRSWITTLQSRSDVGHPLGLFAPLLLLLVTRQVRLRQLYAQRDTVLGTTHPEEKRVMDAYNLASSRLRILAPRLGVRIPYFVDLGGWFTWIKLPEDVNVDLSTTDLPTFLSQDLGEAKVWCSVSGELLEESLKTSGSERVHCLDGNRIDRSMNSQQLVDSVLTQVAAIREAVYKVQMLPTHTTVVEELMAFIAKVFAFNPTKLAPMEELFDKTHRNAWVVENSHFWHLREACDRPLARYVDPQTQEPTPQQLFVSTDTPAGFISRVFRQYANRLALGIPASESFADGDQGTIRNYSSNNVTSSGSFVVSDIGHTFSAPMAAAAGLPLTLLNQYYWITYRDLGSLAVSMARAIRAKVPRGSFVGISGGHSIEWAVCDFACALAGCVSVGIHLTYDPESAYHVFSTTGVSLLCCQESILSTLNKDDNDIDPEMAGFERWSLESLLRVYHNDADASTSGFQLQNVLLFDQALADLTEVSNRVIAQAASSKVTIKVDSVIDLLLAESNAPGTTVLSTVVLEDPDEQPMDGQGGLATVLFTSGSTGRPKGVMVSAKAFYLDIKTRNYQEPMITASYIPLSHSSDRMKMWEFLGNGGRVGFAFFGHSHWLDHERAAKKEGVLSTIVKGAAQTPGSTPRSPGSASAMPTPVPLKRGVSLIRETLEKHHDILALFVQIRALSPTAMACPPNIWNELYQFYVANVLSVEELRQLFGRRISFVITGGAPTSKEVAQWIKTKLLPYCTFADSYGATEVGAITSNGTPIQEKYVRIRLAGALVDPNKSEAENIAEKQKSFGELWVNTPSISLGYIKDPQNTNKAFVVDPHDKDVYGQPTVWYKTGDLVSIEHPGRMVSVGPPGSSISLWRPRLNVRGRVNAMIQLANDVIVCPDILESIYSSSPMISELYMHAQVGGKCLVAVVVAVNKGDRDGDIVKELRRLAKHNELRLEVDVPKAIYVERTRNWTVPNGLLNESLKVVRPRVYAAYKEIIDELLDSVE